WLRTRIEDRVATRAKGREGQFSHAGLLNRQEHRPAAPGLAGAGGRNRPSWWRHSLQELWPLSAHEHAREPIGVESPDKGLRFDGRSARRPELEQHLTAKRQPLVDEDFCPGNTGIFGPTLELPRPARNGDEPRYCLAREPPSVLFPVPHPRLSLPRRYGHFSTPPVSVVRFVSGAQCRLPNEMPWAHRMPRR